MGVIALASVTTMDDKICECPCCKGLVVEADRLRADLIQERFMAGLLRDSVQSWQREYELSQFRLASALHRLDQREVERELNNDKKARE